MAKEDEKTINIKVQLDTWNANISFNVMEIIQELDEDTKAYILDDGGWWTLVSKQMAEDIVNAFSRKSYSSEYTKLRERILNSEAMPVLIAEWAKAMSAATESAVAESRRMNRSYWNLYHWVTEKFYKDCAKPDDFPGIEDYQSTNYSEELIDLIKEQAGRWAEAFPMVAR